MFMPIEGYEVVYTGMSSAPIGEGPYLTGIGGAVAWYWSFSLGICMRARTYRGWCKLSGSVFVVEALCES